MAIKLFKTWREKLKITRYRCAIELGYGVAQGANVKRIEESKITKVYPMRVFQYLLQMGRDAGKSDKTIIDDVLRVKDE